MEDLADGGVECLWENQGQVQQKKADTLHLIGEGFGQHLDEWVGAEQSEVVVGLLADVDGASCVGYPVI